MGDWVYVKLQSYVQSSLKIHRNAKLSPKYYGPFMIVERFGKTAYKLDLPPASAIHPTFHVSLLKPAHGSHTLVTPLPSAPRFHFVPRAIVDNRVVKRGSKAVSQVLVHWVDLPLFEASWEYLDEFKLRFPSFKF